MEKQKETKESLDKKLLLLVHSLRPFEQIVIRKDPNGKPGTIKIFAETVTILEYDLTESKK